MSSSLVVVDGRLVLQVDAAIAGELAALLDQALSNRNRLGLPPLLGALDILDTAEKAAKLAWLGIVPQAVPTLATPDTPHAEWITTEQAAQLLRISARGVRKRIGAGSLNARRIGGRWYIDTGSVQ